MLSGLLGSNYGGGRHHDLGDVRDAGCSDRGSIWNQHRESNAVRAENTRQIERLGDQFGEQLGKLGEGLTSVRERLSRIEGHLRLAPPPTPDIPEGDDRRDSD